MANNPRNKENTQQQIYLIKLFYLFLAFFIVIIVLFDFVFYNFISFNRICLVFYKFRALHKQNKEKNSSFAFSEIEFWVLCRWGGVGGLNGLNSQFMFREGFSPIAENPQIKLRLSRSWRRHPSKYLKGNFIQFCWCHENWTSKNRRRKALNFHLFLLLLHDMFSLQDKFAKKRRGVALLYRLQLRSIIFIWHRNSFILFYITIKFDEFLLLYHVRRFDLIKKWH